MYIYINSEIINKYGNTKCPLEMVIGYTIILIAFTQKTALPFDEGSESFSTSLLFQNIYSVKKVLLYIIW